VAGLLGRAALAVDRGGRRLVGQAGAEPGVAGDVGGLLAGLGHATAHDLLDRAGLEARPLDQADLGLGQQLGGVEAGQPAVALADGRPDGFDDDRLTHVLLPGSMTTTSLPDVDSRTRSSVGAT
jgi:hypothetical protein